MSGVSQEQMKSCSVQECMTFFTRATRVDTLLLNLSHIMYLVCTMYSKPIRGNY